MSAIKTTLLSSEIDPDFAPFDYAPSDRYSRIRTPDDHLAEVFFDASGSLVLWMQHDDADLSMALGRVVRSDENGLQFVPDAHGADVMARFGTEG